MVSAIFAKLDPAWILASFINGRQPKKKMEDDLKKMKKMEDDLNKKWKTNQRTKINLIGCDTIVNSPSFDLSSKTGVYG